MAIESNLKTLPISWLVEQKNNGLLNTSIAIQRDMVWDNTLKSNLIITILYGASIPELCFEKAANEHLIIDGKQRTLSICSFVSNGFALTPAPTYKMVGGVDVSGLKYSELGREFQSRINNHQLSISMFNEMTEGERNFVFYMRNQGRLLSTVELLPAILGESVTSTLALLCEHPFMVNKVRLSHLALRRKDNLKAVVHYLMLQSGQSIGFSGREMIAFCDDIKAGDTQVSFNQIETLFDYLDETFNYATSYLQKPVNIPPILYMAKMAMDRGIEPQELRNKLDNFFEEPNEEYKLTSQQGSAKRTSVQTRVSAITKGVFGSEVNINA